MKSTIEPELDSHLDSARVSEHADSEIQTRTVSRMPRTSQLVLVTAVLLAIGAGMFTVHTLANLRVDEAQKLSDKTASVQMAADEMTLRAGTKSEQLADLGQRITSARADIAKKGLLQ